MKRSEKRPYQISLRLSAAEADMFERLAAHHGLPVSALLRMLVSWENLRITPEAPK